MGKNAKNITVSTIKWLNNYKVTLKINACTEK